uniref:(northern house mosquito) hypothetical protein n=1 Tax=Culex pipiens TaxID=7175 RepID=A0A8D8GCN4_CULPI
MRKARPRKDHVPHLWRDGVAGDPRRPPEPARRGATFHVRYSWLWRQVVLPACPAAAPQSAQVYEQVLRLWSVRQADQERGLLVDSSEEPHGRAAVFVRYLREKVSPEIQAERAFHGALRNCRVSV